MSVDFRTIAQKRIDECRKDQSPYLNLSGCNLYEIPEEVYEMDWVEVLDLSSSYYFEKKLIGIFQKRLVEAIRVKNQSFDYITEWLKGIYQWYRDFSRIILVHNIPVRKNYLKSLNPRIATLPNLHTLLLANNELKEIPPVLADLPRLKVLNLSNNKLRELPSFVGKWTKMELLDLSNNQLKQNLFPIANLTQLQFLNLENNQIDGIFKSISNLQKLKYLNVSKNYLSEVNPEITTIKDLQFLFLGENQLLKVPLCLTELTDLKILELPGTQLTEIPIELAQLKNLQFLSLENNHLGKIPACISELTELKSLVLGNNEIREIPPHIEKLQMLQLLDLKDNQLTQLPFYLAALKKMRYLSLLNNQLEEIPSFLTSLKQLRVLLLAGNQLKEISLHITQLQRLQILSVENNHLTKIPADLIKLKQLKTLQLSKNQLTAIPESVSSLSRLEFLNMESNRLSAIPPHIINLQNLQILSLDNNQLSEIPHYITQLSKLKILSFDKNNLTEIPKHLTDLKQLQYLSLIENELNEIPEYFAALKKLEQLKISDNKIKELKNWAVNIPSLIALHSGGNPIKNIPSEIFDKNANALKSIRSYFKSLETGTGPTRLFEAKLLIVGEGGVGKTSLKYKLKDSSFIAEEGKVQSTEGIDVSQYAYEEDWRKKKETFVLNIWDFGGQEVYHATHQFFLTNSSLYILVWDSRKDARQAGFEYWLRIIQLLGNKSPVLIVKNVFDRRDIPISKSQWRHSFQNIKDFFTINCSLSDEEENGIEVLWKAIREQVQELKHIGVDWGQDRINIRSALEEMAKYKPFISLKEYLKICATEGNIHKESETLDVGQYLHDLGVILHFQDDEHLKETVILRPEWGTAALYKILDDLVVQRRRGILFYTDLATRIWGKNDITHQWKASDYPQYKYPTLLRLMHRFGLCFPIEHTNGKRFIIPELLEADIPDEIDTSEFESPDNPESVLQFVFEYPLFMPKGIITRFMVRTYPYIEQEAYWRKGVILHHDKFNIRALIIQNDVKKAIHIRIIGNDKKAFLHILRTHLNSINKTFGKELKFYEKLPCNCEICYHTTKPHFFDYEELTDYQQDGISDIRCRISRKQVPVQSIINNAFAYQISKLEQYTKKSFGQLENIFDENTEIPIPPPSILCLYHIQNTNTLDKLFSVWNKLRNQNQLRTWSIKGKTVQEKHKDAFDKELQQANIVLLLLSQDFISSNFYSQYLQKKILEHHKKQSIWVIPIYVSPLKARQFPFQNLQGLPNDPTKPQYLTDWENENEGWLNITNGIKQKILEFS